MQTSVLGKKTAYVNTYDPTLLFPIPRQPKREALGIANNTLPFFGYDIWNHYEVSWLNPKGKPIVSVAEIIYSCDSKNIIESKSMKLYFNSFNNTRFDHAEAVRDIIIKDLSERLDTRYITVNITPLNNLPKTLSYKHLNGFCLDQLDISCSVYQTTPDFLIVDTDNIIVEETVYSDLLKSNCLVTNQPDWCSVEITYTGKKINHAGLLRYLVSFRNENEFHEQCIEKIFMHILTRCQPKALTVYGRSTRRGGIDINSHRSTQPIESHMIKNNRLHRQ